MRKSSPLFAALSLVLFLALSICGASAQADLLYEGYTKIMIGQEHIGWAVTRYEFDSKKKEFTGTTFIKTNSAGGSVTQSLKARAGEKLGPIAYTYNQLQGTKFTSVEATFQGLKMDAVVKADGKTEKVSRSFPEGTFLSTFLPYLMLQGKAGLKTGTKYSYSAIAEEDGKAHPGEALIDSEVKNNGISAFKVIDSFNGQKYISHLTDKGEQIYVKQPEGNFEFILVADPKEATEGITVNNSTLELLFGDVPKGLANEVVRAKGKTVANKPANKPAEQAAPQKVDATNPDPNQNLKKEGIEGGKAIETKAAPQKE